MYLTRRLRCARTAGNSPCADLLRTGSEKADKTEQRIACLNEAVKTALRKPEILEEHRLFVRLKHGNLRLYLRADGEYSSTLLGSSRSELYISCISGHIAAYLIL